MPGRVRRTGRVRRMKSVHPVLQSAFRSDPRLGMGKHYLELADSFRGLGWEAHAVGPDEIAGGPTRVTLETFPSVLRDFLRRTAAGYDVVEYDHAYLPFPRSDFPPGPLFVARCMLLHHHFLTTPVPPVPRLRSWLGHALRRPAEEAAGGAGGGPNRRDGAARRPDGGEQRPGRRRPRPQRCRPGPDCGLAARPDPERLRQFAAVPDAVPDRPVVGFVGTFDPRKGMCEFPGLVDRVARRVPGVTFRLLGTAGLVPDADGVRHYFPRRLRPLLEIGPRYDPKELPGLLTGVSVGVFPSRVESFGYGVLEMLAAAVPVIAYDAPGPHVMLPPKYRVPVGAVRELADQVGDLLIDPDRLRAARLWARARAAEFRWEEIAVRTAAAYTQRLAEPPLPAGQLAGVGRSRTLAPSLRCCKAGDQ